MAQLAPISLTVDSTTYEYGVQSQQGVRATFTLPQTNDSLTEVIKLTGQVQKKTSANRAGQIVIDKPIEVTDINANHSIKAAHVDIKFVIPREMSFADIELLRKKAQALLANALVADLVDYGRAPY